MKKAKRDFLINNASDAELLSLYRHELEAREKAGFFTEEGEMSGHIARLLGEELTRRGREADLLAVAMLNKVQQMKAEDLGYLAGILASLTMPGGVMAAEFDYDDDGDPCDPRTSPFDTFILFLMAAAADRNREAEMG